MTTVDYLWPFIKDEYRFDRGGPGRLFTPVLPDPDAVYDQVITDDVGRSEPHGDLRISSRIR